MGISPESSEEEILEVFTTCKVSICVVENLHQFGKVYQVSAHTRMHARKVKKGGRVGWKAGRE